MKSLRYLPLAVCFSSGCGNASINLDGFLEEDTNQGIVRTIDKCTRIENISNERELITEDEYKTFNVEIGYVSHIKGKIIINHLYKTLYYYQKNNASIELTQQDFATIKKIEIKNYQNGKGTIQIDKDEKTTKISYNNEEQLRFDDLIVHPTIIKASIHDDAELNYLQVCEKIKIQK